MWVDKGVGPGGGGSDGDWRCQRMRWRMPTRGCRVKCGSGIRSLRRSLRSTVALMRRFVAPTVLVALLSSARESSSPRATESLARTINALRSYRLTEDMEYGAVPPDVAALMQTLKGQIRSLIEATLNDPQVRDLVPAGIQRSVSGRLGQEGVVVGRVPLFHGFGAVNALEFKGSAGPRLLF